MKGHPVLLNRAPTLHRLGIQAFQPVMIEGKAIRLHPLVCTAFNADFDGDQMAVHLPLGEAAVLEAQLLMLASHNILNPANGAPVTVPSQDMVLGLYYMTKSLKGAKGEGLSFYSEEEVKIAFNESIVDLHSIIKVRTSVKDGEEFTTKLIETTVGRVLFNEHVPSEVGYIDQLLTKKALRDIIGDVLSVSGIAKTAEFLDAIKGIGYHFAFKGGLSFNLGDVIIPDEKDTMITDAYNQVDEVTSNYNMGFITNNERYNQVIDIWSNTNAHLTEKVMKQLSSDKDGFNSVYMMLDSGARGSKEQIKQLGGMRGLMAKPQKSGDKSGAAIIENPIIANFKEGLSILEYFISTHGARKGLADTALKTADAGYLTRRLVDASQDVVIKIEDCGTLRGLEISAYKKNDEVVESLKDRIVGRVSLHNVYDQDGNIILSSDEMIVEKTAQAIEDAQVESVEVRSVLTCEAKKGVCAKCYGRNLSTGNMAVSGDTVGVVAAQSIGEPGTQLTLRTFHFGGTASKIASESSIVTKYDGKLEIDDLKTIETVNEEGEKVQMVISRTSEVRIIDEKLGIVLSSSNIPYGSNLYVEPGKKVKKGTKICDWDPYNAIIVSEFEGKVVFKDIVEGLSFRVESDEQTGFEEKVMIERKDKTLNPTISIVSKKDENSRSYSIPVKAHLSVDDNQKIKPGQIIAKIPRLASSLGDITGGLPRVTELFEARNPSNPAVVTEIDGIVSFGPKIKRGNKEVIITSKTGEVSKYLIPLSKHILVQENDFVKSGMPLCDGAITPSDILRIKGPTAVQEYIVNEIQEVYRLQGMKINDKHFEVVVRQMMRKMSVIDAGDTRFLDGQIVTKLEFLEENDRVFGMKVVEESGDSQILKLGQIISARKLREENSRLKRKDLKTVEVRNAVPATSEQKIQGITRAALQTNSWVSAASFQETTKVLNAAAINGKRDTLEGLKENVIVGHKIPAGTGLRDFDDIVVGSQEEFDELMSAKEKEEEKQQA
jgi:DNA-directed RNA polymerase subunit beta'